ncbi:MAG: RNA polymerase subunit sigma [Eubacterium sp.]|nr:RNA polymerase subunit sigma [Eubacterium sp.]
MREEHVIVQQILEAQQNVDVADRFIRQYMPYIKSETAKFIKRVPVEGHDEELNIAMFAFYEAMRAYCADKGAFLPLASMTIKNRLIDHYRKEQRHAGVIYYDKNISDEDEETTFLDGLANEVDEYEAMTLREATKDEIAHFTSELADFGLCLSDVADSCPKQERTLQSCMKVLAYAKSHPEIIELMLGSKKLPITALAQGAGVEKKTLERHRKYVLAILLAFTNGFEIIRGHLYQLQK